MEEPPVPPAGDQPAGTPPAPGYPPPGYAPGYPPGYAAPPAFPYPPAYGYRPPVPGPAPGIVYATFWRRLGGYLIDAVVVTIGSLVILWPYVIGPYLSAVGGRLQEQVQNQINSGSSGVTVITPQSIPLTSVVSPGVIAVCFGIVAVLTAAYWTLMLWLGGASLGQKAVGVRVVRAGTLAKLDPGRAFLRSIVYWVSGLFAVAAPSISWGVRLLTWLTFLAVAWDAKKQGWHDKLAGSLVVRDEYWGGGAYPPPGGPGAPPPGYPPAPGYPSTPGYPPMPPAYPPAPPGYPATPPAPPETPPPPPLGS